MINNVTINLSDQQRKILEKWIRKKSQTPQRLFMRSQIILMSEQGVGNTQQAHRLNVTRQLPRRWRARWALNEERLNHAEQEGASEKDLAILMVKVLSDNYRSGTPSTFTAEKLTQIIAVSCEKLEDSELPLTHWTPSALATEVIQRGIVDSISVRHVDRVLKGGLSDSIKPNIG